MPSQIPDRPRIAPATVAEATDDSTVVFRTADTHFKEIGGEPAGPVLVELLPLLREGATREELLEVVPDLTPEDLGDLLQALWSEDLIVDESDGDRFDGSVLEHHGSDLQYLQSLPGVRDGADALEKIRSGTVGVWGAGPAAGHAALSLAEAGVGNLTLVHPEEPPDGRSPRHNPFPPAGQGRRKALRSRLEDDAPDVEVNFREWATDTGSLADDISEVDVAVAAPTRQKPLHRFNQAAHEAGTVWVPVAHTGFVGTIGPTILPGKTPCYRCYELRKDSHRQFLDEARATRDRSASELPPTGLAPFGRILGGQAAHEALRLLADLPNPRHGEFVEFRFPTADIEVYSVLRLPVCDVCGNPVEVDGPSRGD